MMYRIGSQYYVRALREADLLADYPDWFEDQEVCRYNAHGKFPKTADYFQQFYKDLNNEDRLVWAICHDDDGHIGNISLQAISSINRNAEFAVILGDRRHWGKNVALDAANQIISHAFNKLNLERIHCGTAATNMAMRKLANKLGMTQEGIRRHHLWLDGEWVDVVQYGLLRSEWLEARS